PKLTGLSQGVYSDSIVLTTNLANSPVSVPVLLVVQGGLTVSQPALSFHASVNGGPSAPQSLSVGAPQATAFTVSASASWLTFSPLGSFFATNRPLSVSATPAGLTPGTYSGFLELTANGISQRVPVTFAVGEQLLTADPATLTFVGKAGGSSV